MPKLGAALRKDFDPNEPRDESGKWTLGAAATPAAESEAHKKLQASCAAAYEAAQKPLARGRDKLKSLFPHATITGRAKKADSMFEKCKKEGKGPAELFDVIGFRITVDSANDFKGAVEKIKRDFHVVREKDLLETPLGDYYRSYHLNIELEGRVAEIQIRTPNQTKLADWAHETIYKDHHPNAAAIREHLNDLNEYAKQMSAYYYACDTGKGGVNPPPCTEVVRITIGCL